jgi:hypothetical protein
MENDYIDNNYKNTMEQYIKERESRKVKIPTKNSFDSYIEERYRKRHNEIIVKNTDFYA